jgi:HTH-type transcriptional regulator, sugar sensing transcriptional regulator
MQENIKESVEILKTLGFNELEAAAYTFLVENSPVTAYRVAQGIGKPVANTYKAVESLKEKGAVLIDETGNKLCRAIPPAELLRKLEKQFRQKHQKAEKVLSRLRPADGDDGIYTLSTPDEVFNTCAEMLERAEEVVLVDAFPQLLEQIKGQLEDAAGRGIHVVVQGYTSMEIKGIDYIINNQASTISERWKGQWLCVMIDGAEYLFAYLSEDSKHVHQAIWSGSTFLAWLEHGNLVDAMLYSELERLIQQNAPRKEMLKAIERKNKWKHPNTKGYQKLRAKFEADIQ